MSTRSRGKYKNDTTSILLIHVSVFPSHMVALSALELFFYLVLFSPVFFYPHNISWSTDEPDQDILAQNKEAKRRFDARMDELSEFVDLQVFC